MMFSYHPLPSSRSEGSRELNDYVRHEYREDNPCWFASNAVSGGCVKLPGDKKLGEPPRSMPTVLERQSHGSGGCRCPVMNAVSGGSISRSSATRGGGNGSP